MDGRILYFAYGSNMAIERLRSRVSSAELICLAELMEHKLKFHKPSKKDGSGKCDAAYTGNSEDSVFGVIYSIQIDQLMELDKFEGCGHNKYNYERKTVSVISHSKEKFNVETYIAICADPQLHPFDWYKEHVLRGARAVGLPLSYITQIDSFVADIDADETRRAKELAIYGAE